MKTMICLIARLYTNSRDFIFCHAFKLLAICVRLAVFVSFSRLLDTQTCHPLFALCFSHCSSLYPLGSANKVYEANFFLLYVFFSCRYCNCYIIFMPIQNGNHIVQQMLKKSHQSSSTRSIFFALRIQFLIKQKRLIRCKLENP